jgi:hypothetical protein
MMLFQRASRHKLYRYIFRASTIKIYDEFYSLALDLMFKTDNV